MPGLLVRQSHGRNAHRAADDREGCFSRRHPIHVPLMAARVFKHRSRSMRRSRSREDGTATNKQKRNQKQKQAPTTVRAIWQGTLVVENQRIAVKVFSAVVDRQVHFHLLHKTDRTRVQQRMVDSETERVVPLDEARKAFEAEPGLYVVINSDDVEQTTPEPGREIHVSRCVPTSAVDPQLFDRPYYLGPTAGSETDYWALAQALEAKQRAGIVSWVMRAHSYTGALVAQDGYLMIITLRHAEQVIPVSQLEPPQGPRLDPKEEELAEKLVEALSGEFDPGSYHAEFQDRLRELIDAKRTGKKIKPKPTTPRRRERSLADSLRASLKAASANRRA
jgi:DNA end-binding protein Ku